MGGEDQGEATGGALGGEAADLRLAPRAEVAFPRRLVVARAGRYAVGGAGGQRPAGEAHHQERGLALLARAGDGRRGGGEEEVVEVRLVLRDGVRAVGAGVGLGAQLCADGYLCGESDDRDPDAVGDQVGDGVVDIARVAR